MAADSDKLFFEKQVQVDMRQGQTAVEARQIGRGPLSEAEIDDVLAGLDAIPDHALLPYRFVAHTGLV